MEGLNLKAFSIAKQMCIENLSDTSALKYFLPWLIGDLEMTRKIMGKDFCPYGLEKNLKTLNTLIQYSTEQGLIKKGYKTRRYIC